MQHIVDSCSFFYNAHHIPVYIYSDRRLAACFPEQPPVYYPTSDFDDYIDVCNPFLSYLTSENLIMGYFPITGTNIEILIGPINTIAYSLPQIAQFIHRKKIGIAYQESCMDFYNAIPIHSHLEFIDLILLLRFMLTDEMITRSDYFDYQDRTISDCPKNNIIQSRPDSEILENHAKSTEIILRYIENGDSDGVFQYLCSQQPLPAVDFGSTPLTRRRHLAYYSIGLFSDAANRGGLPITECAEIVASYYNDITSADSIENIDFLTGRAALFFTNKVSSIKLPMDISSVLLQCIQYVHQNTYNHIQVADIASQVGYSRVHISRLFKNELGFGPAQLILRSKLEEAKVLLEYTDKPLSEISSMLCFANQSHFQRCFKNQFQITPMQYRNRPK